MKLLILGARGMLGTDLMEVFSDFGPIGWDRQEIDVTSPVAVRSKLLDLKPQIIINATGYTNVDGAESNEPAAFAVNADAVTLIAQAATDCHATLVHYSTDYVFDGEKQEGYSEYDEPAVPLSVYGQSKLAGERALQEWCPTAYCVRTSWLFGHAGKNFVQTMIALAERGEPITVVDDQWGKPTSAHDVAVATRELVTDAPEWGTYHLVNEGVTTWYQFARQIFKLKGLTASLEPITTAQVRRPAPRPRYSGLINTKRPALRPWAAALSEYLRRWPAG